MTNSNSSRTFVDSRYILRLVVIKVEGVLVPPPNEWGNPTETTDFNFNPDTLFPQWAEELDRDTDRLRRDLKTLARQSPPEVSNELRSFLDYVCNHTPIRVGFLSGGPREWIQTLESTRNLDNLRDLTFCYDNYPHGSRRTLLQFLMNRFIAGKGRTLLLGNTLDDESIAKTEKTRFRALTDPPPDCENPNDWSRSIEEIRSFVEEHQPTE